MPVYAIFFMLFTMASVGLPGTSGFVGEFLVFMGAYKASSWMTLVILTGIILGAAYALYLYRRIIFGSLEKEDLKALTDLSLREKVIMIPIAAVVLWMGVYPKPFLDPIHAPVEALVERIERAAPAGVAATLSKAAATPAKEVRDAAAH
jgi:NADH-quinone oxidoreductase subunit M